MGKKSSVIKADTESEGTAPSAKKTTHDDNNINAVAAAAGEGAEAGAKASKIEGDASSEDAKGTDEEGEEQKQEQEQEQEEEEEEEVYVLENAEAAAKVEPPRTIEAGDSLKVKQVLDDSVLVLLNEMRYECDHNSENWKLFLMTLACCFGLLAQFYPAPWPDNRMGVGVCVGAYFLISGLLQFIITFVDDELIITTLEGKAYQSVADFRLKKAIKAAAVAKAKKEGEKVLNEVAEGEETEEEKNQTLFLQRQAMQVHSSFDKYQEYYSLRLNQAGAPAGDSEKNKERTVAKMYVGKYFTVNGEFDEERFWGDLCTHIQRYEQGIYGSFTYDHKSD